MIIGAGAILVIFIVYMIFFYKFGGNNEAAPSETATTSQTALPEATTTALTPADQAAVRAGFSRTDMTSDDLSKMATSFAERFGSYSNQSNYENISDLQVFMSKKMRAWADEFIAQAKKNYSAIYYGVTTSAVSAEVKKFDTSAGQAEVLVKTQRQESTGTMSNGATSYQDLLLSFVKERNSWKVDSAVWQKAK